MEPAHIPLPQSGSSSPSSSRSAFPSPSLPPSEWPFPAFRPSRSSSRSSSSWPFVAERSPSPSSSASSCDPRRHPYRPVLAENWKDGVGIYPPILPPPDFFDLEEEEKWIKEDLFKKDNVTNILYDETGMVNLPVDEKGILILDPVSRTRLIDARVELNIFNEYSDWIDSAIEEAEELGAKQSVDWLKELRRAVMEDHEPAKGEDKIVVDEERKKRGLTDFATHLQWLNTESQRLVHGRHNEEEQGDAERTETQSERQCPSRTEPSEQEDDGEDEGFSDNPRVVPKEDQESPTEPLTAHDAESTATSERSPTPPPLVLITLWW